MENILQHRFVVSRDGQAIYRHIKHLIDPGNPVEIIKRNRRGPIMKSCRAFRVISVRAADC